jgi:hypothetical protein
MVPEGYELQNHRRYRRLQRARQRNRTSRAILTRDPNDGRLFLSGSQDLGDTAHELDLRESQGSRRDSAILYEVPARYVQKWIFHPYSPFVVMFEEIYCPARVSAFTITPFAAKLMP